MNENDGNHSKQYTINNTEEHEKFFHFETTAYRGLHFLDVTIFQNDRIDKKLRYGVYIE